MYINKVYPYWKDEELKQDEERKQRYNELLSEISGEPLLSNRWLELSGQQDKIVRASRELLAVVQERYISSFSRKPSKVFDDIKEIVNSTTREEYVEEINLRREVLHKIYADSSDPDKVNKEWSDLQSDFYSENYNSFTEFIEERLLVQRKVIERYNQPYSRYKAIIDKHVSKYYKQEQPSYVPFMQSKPTNALAEMSIRDFVADPVSDQIRQTVNGVTVTVNGKAELRKNPQALKLLDILVTKACTIVPYHATADEILRSREVSLSVADYMRICKLKDAKNAREQLSNGLKFLYLISVDWEETDYHDHSTGRKLRKPETTSHHARILDEIGDGTGKPINRGTATLKFNPDIIESLSYGYYMPMPTFLFGVNSNKHPYAYQIGRKLAQHKNMNVGKPNENRISVEKLLQAVSDLPTYEEVINSNDRHVTERIIEPFERSLLALQEEYEGLEWRYCNSRGEPITDRQAEDYSYSEWITWLIEFNFKDYPDQTERLEEINAIKNKKRQHKLEDKSKRG